MSFSVHCDCGRTLPVTAAMAGSSVACSCGRQVNVPQLSRLRVAAGQGAYQTSIVDVVRGMLRDGRLPPSHACEQCAAPTDAALECVIICERPVARSRGGRSNFGSSFWLTVLLLPLGIFFWRSWLTDDGADVVVHGHEVTVPVPLRLCARCRDEIVAGTGRRQLRELLARVPEVAQLLREYPEADVLPGRDIHTGRV